MAPFELLSKAAIMPTRATSGSAGYDVHCTEDFVLAPGSSMTVATGITAKFPRWMRVDFKSKSGLAFNHKVTVFPGLIDSDYYPKEIKALMINNSIYPRVFIKGNKIAQLVFSPVITFEDAEGVRDGGFGSTDTTV